MKYFVTTLDEVDEAYHTLYEKVEGGYRLKVEGVVDKARLDEFRENNIALKKQQEELQAQLDRFSGVDLDKYKKAMERDNQLRDKKLIEEGKVDELVQHRTADMKRAYEEQVQALQQARAEAEGKSKTFLEELSKLKIDTSVQQAVASVGSLRKGAIHDVLNRARQDFSITNDGKLQPKEGMISSTGDPIKTIDDWAKSLIGSAGYLFEAAGGGGAGGSNANDRAPGAKTIKSDPVVFGQNLEGIAAGKVKVAR